MLSSQTPLPLNDYRDITDNPPADVVDWNTFAEFVAGDLELMDELVVLYQADSQQLINKIGQSLASRQFEELTLHAHGLKGSSANVHAGWVRHWAYLLEQAARKQDLETADYAFYELQKAFDEYRQHCNEREVA
jgi:HPt (histidine-containing phosphotransfer) domain-containing protein